MNQQELINAYLDGKLNSEDRKLFENLLQDDPNYQAELEKQRELRKETLQSEPKSGTNPSDEIHSHPLKTGLRSWLISATAAVIIVVFGYFLWTTLSMSPGEKLYAKYYQPFPHQANSSPGENTGDIASKAFQAYAKGNYKMAAEWFEQVKTPHDSGFALFYLGICYLEIGRPDKAIPVLNRIPVNSAIVSKEVASWYEAMGYFKLNMLDKGKSALEIAAAKPNPYQAQAKEVLKTLK